MNITKITTLKVLLTTITTALLSNTIQAKNLSSEQFLIGTFGEGVYNVTLDKEQQKLTNQQLMIKAEKPSYLTLGKNHHNLYLYNGIKKTKMQKYLWNSKKKAFSLEQEHNIGEQPGTHIAVNDNQTEVAVSNYNGGDFTIFRQKNNSNKLEKVAYFKPPFSKDTPKKERPKMHYNDWDHQDRFLYLVDLGSHNLQVFDSHADKYTPRLVAQLARTDGPRHFVFHPNNDWMYLLNEWSSSIIVYKQNPKTGDLTQIQRIELLDESYGVKTSSSAIRASKDGKFIYAGIRTTNEIAVLKVGKQGTLTLVQKAPTLGNWPRDFNLSEHEDYIVIANQKSNELNVLKRDTTTGLLSPTKIKLTLPSPTYVGYFNPQ